MESAGDIALHWSTASFTEIGKRRSRNEDAIGIYLDQCLWLVADGMGGHDAGDYASSHLVDVMSRYRRQTRRGASLRELKQLLACCNADLLEKARTDGLSVCGTTVAALTFLGDSVVCFWSGDSRVYRYRNGVLKQLTRDHSVQNWLEDADRGHSSPSELTAGKQLTSAIGGADALGVEFSWYLLQDNDAFLICTDGLYNEIDEKKLSEILGASRTASESVIELERYYHKGPARDNVAAIYVALH